MNTYKILITGGSGFIGTNLIDYFITNGHIIINIDYCKPQKESHIQFWKDIDITNYTILEKAILDFNPDYIVHLAARTDLYGNTIDDYNANIQGVANIINISHLLPSLKKIIITSSMLVCHTGYQPKDQLDYSPTTLYGESKVKTENIVWENPPRCDWAIIRPTSIWGPWFGIPYKNFFDMIIAKKYFHIGHKGCTKTYGFVGNAVYQISNILFKSTTNYNNKVFYIGDNPPTNIEEWANEIAFQLNQKIYHIPFFMIKIAAIIGDLLKKCNILFPMTSFRLKNMTTNNIVNLQNTYEIAPNPPYKRKEAIAITLNWIKNQDK